MELKRIYDDVNDEVYKFACQYLRNGSAVGLGLIEFIYNYF